MYLAIDIGGTKTLLGRFTNEGVLQESFKFPTPKIYEDFLRALAENVARITTREWSGVCVAAPGRIDRKTGVVIRCGNLGWENTPLKEDVRKITKSKVLLENDAKLAGLSEARQLKPARRRVLYVTISTGIGVAIINKGTIDTEFSDAGGAGLFFEHHGKVVKWEHFASGKAIVERFHKRASDIEDPHVWQIIAHDISLGLVDIIANTQPDIVIIGGGVGSHFKKYAKPLKKELDKYESPLVVIPPVTGAKRAEEAVIYGCYELLKDQ